jgi:hypothetical protein
MFVIVRIELRLQDLAVFNSQSSAVSTLKKFRGGDSYKTATPFARPETAASSLSDAAKPRIT